MELITEFAVLTAATVLAVGAAIGLNWFLLNAAFQLMQPAGVRPVPLIQRGLVRGTRAVARGYSAVRS
jgi:hypothetical protein